MKKGLVMLCKTQHALDDEACTAERARELGIPAEVLDARKTAELDPAVTMDVLGSVYFPSYHPVPARFLAHLEQQILGNGGRFLWNTEVTGWETEGDRVTGIRTSKGTAIRN